MLASRSRDPAVLVDIPQDPNADEVAAANTIAGQVTPALPSGEMDGVVESVERKDKSWGGGNVQLDGWGYMASVVAVL